MPIQSDNPPELVTLELWKGLNQQSKRGSIDDNEEWWNENLFAIGPGNLRACWGPSGPIYTAPAGLQVRRVFFGFYGNQTSQFGAPPPGAMGWFFLSDGSIDEVDLNTHGGTGLRAQGAIWEPIAPQYWASAKVWRPQFFGSGAGQQGGVLFGSPKGLYAWDGTTLSKPGDPAPDWLTDLKETDPGVPVDDVQTLSLTGAPTGGSFTLTFAGATTASIAFNASAADVESAMVALSSVGSGNVACTGGPLPGSVVITFQGSLGNAAQPVITVGANNLTGGTSPAPNIVHTTTGSPGATMPSGLPGIYAMEVYQSRLWVAGKDVISFSAPSNGADFSTTNGGGSFGYFGDKLVYTYVHLHAVAGYLFVFGDSSTDLISNLQLTGSGTPTAPYTTNFNYENIDPQVGQRFPRPVGVIGRNMILFNLAGFFLMQGGDAQPIGDKLTSLWNTLDTSAYLPTFATVQMHGFRVLICNGRFRDPWGVTRNMQLMYHPTRGHEFWSVASQGLELNEIGTYEQDSVCLAYGTDGTHLYQLFAQPDPTLIKRYASKQLRGKGSPLIIKNFKRLYAEIEDNDGRGVQISGSVTSGDGGVPGGVQTFAFDLPPGRGHGIIPQPLEGAGIWGAIDLTSYSPDFSLQRLHLATEERTLYGA
jgi:hypothetical protein